jgi:hypothetical protein
MFAIVKDNTVQQIIQEGSQFTVDGVTYANNWFQLATQEEKTALGVMEVVYGARPDDRFYWVTESAPAIENGVVQINYTHTDKLLNDTPEVDKDGNPVYVQEFDPTLNNGQGGMKNTTVQAIQTGLKTQYINQIRQTVWAMLNPTDYVDSRKANDPTYTPPANILTWRASVRTTMASQITAINACTTVDQLILLTNVNWPKEP